MSINIVALTGRLGADPTTRNFDSGAVKVSLSLAVDKYVKGEKETHWFEIEVWGKPAETLASYGKKGKLIGITGTLETETYATDGGKRKRVYIRAERVELLSSSETIGSNQQATTAGVKEAPDF